MDPRRTVTALAVVLAIWFVPGCGVSNSGVSENSRMAASVKSVTGLTDATVCEELSKYDLMTTVLKNQFEYLCKKGGLQELREKGFFPMTSANNSGISTFVLAGHQRVKAAMSSAANLFRQFCNDFEVYREIAPDAFERVDEIATENISNAGCNYHFYGTKILFFRPEYTGVIDFLNPRPEIFVSADHLVKSVSLVKDVRSMGIAVQDGEYLDLYSIGFNQSENKGMHDKVYEELVASAQALRDGVAAHINEY